jgi:hypothetical protein
VLLTKSASFADETAVAKFSNTYAWFFLLCVNEARQSYLFSCLAYKFVHTHHSDVRTIRGATVSIDGRYYSASVLPGSLRARPNSAAHDPILAVRWVDAG